MEIGNCPGSWLLSPELFFPHPELLLISYVKPTEKYLAFEPRTETKFMPSSNSLYARDAKIEKFNINSVNLEANEKSMCRNFGSI
jgi:hypothetical protein